MQLIDADDFSVFFYFCKMFVFGIAPTDNNFFTSFTWNLL